MKTITIIFVGLIAHVNQPGMSFDDTAVLMASPHHRPVMVVKRDAIANPHNQWVETACKAGADCEILLEGLTVKLEGTRRGFCNKDAVARGVPRLRTVASSCRGLRAAVRNRDAAGDFAAFVDYGAGKLTVDQYFHETISFEGPAGPRICAACRVRYDGVLQGNYAVFVFEKNKQAVGRLHVHGDHYVTVENAPTPPSHDDDSHFIGDNHFPAFYKLFETCDDPPVPVITTTGCPQPNICSIGGIDTPLADCTNSQYP